MFDTTTDNRINGKVIKIVFIVELNGINALYWYLSKDEKISINIKVWIFPFTALMAVSFYNLKPYIIVLSHK